LDDADVNEEYVKSLRNQPYLHNASADINLEKQRKYVENIRFQENHFLYGFFVNGDLVGTSGIQIDHNRFTVHLGILILKKHTGFGLGKILTWAVCFLTARYVPDYSFHAGCDKNNISSRNVFLGVGFTLEKSDSCAYWYSCLENQLSVSSEINNVKIVSTI
jgi:RimJ/RimL family protein N-acetyltransferase